MLQTSYITGTGAYGGLPDMLSYYKFIQPNDRFSDLGNLGADPTQIESSPKYLWKQPHYLRLKGGWVGTGGGGGGGGRECNRFHSPVTTTWGGGGANVIDFTRQLPLPIYLSLYVWENKEWL